MMRVSVVIPVYNAVAYLDAALRSVFAQTGVELEVIAVDDGSTDESAAVLARWAAAHPNLLLVREANAGQGAARNRGLELATGDYVYFMDADDELGATDALARLVQAMEAERLDLLFFDAETRADPGVTAPDRAVRADYYRRPRSYGGVRTGEALYAAMVRAGDFCVSPPLMLLRRSFLVSSGVRFPAARIFYEDNVFTTHALLAAKRASHRAWLLYVRKVHAGSTVTSAPTLRHLRGYLACCHDVEALLGERRWDRATRTALKSRRVVYRRYARKLVREHPDLAREAKAKLGDAERALLDDILRYPLPEKIVSAFRCLRERGPVFTLRRLMGRRAD